MSFFINCCLIQLRYFWWNYLLNNFNLLAGLLKLVCFMDRRYIYIMISDQQQNVGIHFLAKYVLQQQFLYCFIWSSNQFLILNLLSYLYFLIFPFSSDFFTNQLDFSLFLPLYLLPSTSCPYNLFPSFWWMVLEIFRAFLDAVHARYHAYKLRYVPHASRITTSGTILFSCI